MIGHRRCGSKLLDGLLRRLYPYIEFKKLAPDLRRDRLDKNRL